MNTLLSSIQLIQIFEPVNVQITLSNQIRFYGRICKLLKKNEIPFQTSYPLDPPKRFDLHFGSDVNFQDLYIIVAILENFGLQSIFLTSNISNEICIGSYITECCEEERRDVSQGVDVGEFLKTSFSATIEEVIIEKFPHSAVDEKRNISSYDIESDYLHDDSEYDDLDDSYYSENSNYNSDEYFSGDIRTDSNENPWIDVFGPGEEAETAYWNTD